MNKQQLRAFYLNKRKQLKPEEVQLRSEHITSALIKKDIWHAKLTVHCFLPIQSTNEYNSLPFIEFLWSKGCQVVVPKADFDTKKMETVLFTKETRLTKRKGIPEPLHPIPVAENTIDLMLVPLLIADINGHRIGYGGGFYDRFLADKKHIKTIGIALFPPVETVFSEAHDHLLDEVVSFS